MTDLTDQDRRIAHEWAASLDPNMKCWSDRERAAARVILATVDAPAPTLSERLWDIAEHWEEWDTAVITGTLAASADRAPGTPTSNEPDTGSPNAEGEDHDKTPDHRLPLLRLRRPRPRRRTSHRSHTRLVLRIRRRTVEDPRASLADRPQPPRHDHRGLERRRAGRHHHRRHPLPRPQHGRQTRRHDRRHPIQPLGQHARSHQHHPPHPRHLGKRLRSPVSQCRIR